MKYPICFIKENQRYKIEVPDLAGCEASCHDIDEGFDIATKAITDYLSILAEYGEAIPNASLVSQHQSRIENVIWAVINIDITPYLGKSHKINVTLPELLIKQIDDRVSKSEEYKTRSGFIASACLAELK